MTGSVLVRRLWRCQAGAGPAGSSSRSSAPLCASSGELQLVPRWAPPSAPPSGFAVDWCLLSTLRAGGQVGGARIACTSRRSAESLSHLSTTSGCGRPLQTSRRSEPWRSELRLRLPFCAFCALLRRPEVAGSALWPCPLFRLAPGSREAVEEVRGGVLLLRESVKDVVRRKCPSDAYSASSLLMVASALVIRHCFMRPPKDEMATADKSKMTSAPLMASTTS
mmetsp:Transcript_26324/g.71536  ORF Transcript_26324/g.71536 Transcript_26324/m.71536 type:complete len:223 (+) Transcript_26324:349-1017(+)